jgi:CHASE3 domain sensor protein
MKWDLKPNAKLAFGVAIAIFSVNSILEYQNAGSLVTTNRQVVHTHEVLTELESTLSTLKDAKTVWLGCVITGDERELAPYFPLQSELSSRIPHLRELTAGNPDQQQTLDKLELLIAERMATLRECIKARKTTSLEAASQHVLPETVRTMGQIGSAIAKMETEERPAEAEK